MALGARYLVVEGGESGNRAPLDRLDAWRGVRTGEHRSQAVGAPVVVSVPGARPGDGCAGALHARIASCAGASTTVRGALSEPSGETPERARISSRVADAAGPGRYHSARHAAHVAT